jgi:AraC-like DNA-binding protein
VLAEPEGGCNALGAMPSPLAEYVRGYDYSEWTAGRGVYPFAVTVFPALTFYLRKRCRAFGDVGQQHVARPRVIAIGPCDYRAKDIAQAPYLATFTIVFQPTGFYRLFRISAWEALNHTYVGRDLLSTCLRGLCARLRATSCPAEVVRVAEAVLLRAMATALPQSRIYWAGQVLLDSNGRADLLAIAKSLGFSDSSWRRHFCSEIGVTPKRYARLLRFRHAIALKRACEARPWTEICLEAGYYDQAHFIADCQALVGYAPGRFMRDLALVPAGLATTLYGSTPPDIAAVRGQPNATSAVYNAGRVRWATRALLSQPVN